MASGLITREGADEEGKSEQTSSDGLGGWQGREPSVQSFSGPRAAYSPSLRRAAPGWAELIAPTPQTTCLGGGRFFTVL